jgi:enoyl-CoA hydratase
MLFLRSLARRRGDAGVTGGHHLGDCGQARAADARSAAYRLDRKAAVVSMIEREDVDGIAVVRLAHGKVNALDLELLDAITGTCAGLDAGPSHAVVFTGTGKAFSAGVDLWRILDGGAEYAHAFLPALSRTFLALFNLGKPVVAAVNGHAIAGGCVLANACDERIMADGDGRIGVTELLVGVPFPIAALEILAFAMGERAAREAVLTAATHRPAEALARGYVDEVVAPDRLLDHALATAVRLSTYLPPDAYRMTKRQLRLRANENLMVLADRPWVG